MQIKTSFIVGAVLLASSAAAIPIAEPNIISDVTDKAKDIVDDAKDKVHNITQTISDLIPKDIKDEFKDMNLKAYHLLSEFKSDVGDLANVSVVPITDALPFFNEDAYNNGSNSKYTIIDNTGKDTGVSLDEYVAKNMTLPPVDSEGEDECGDDDDADYEEEGDDDDVEKRSKSKINFILKAFRKKKTAPDFGKGKPKPIPPAKFHGSTGRRKDTSHPNGHCGWPKKSYPLNMGGGTAGEMFCIIDHHEGGGLCRTCVKGVHPEHHACTC